MHLDILNLEKFHLKLCLFPHRLCHENFRKTRHLRNEWGNWVLDPSSLVLKQGTFQLLREVETVVKSKKKNRSESMTKSAYPQLHSTVSFVRWKGGRYTADVIFNFTLQCRSPAHINNHYSEYQFFLYQTITEQRDKGKTFDQIAEWLNKKGYLSVRGKRFKGNHVHSIVRKKTLRDKKLEREYPEVWSDFSLEVVDKTLANMFEDFFKHAKNHL